MSNQSDVSPPIARILSEERFKKTQDPRGSLDHNPKTFAVHSSLHEK